MKNKASKAAGYPDGPGSSRSPHQQVEQNSIIRGLDGMVVPFYQIDEDGLPILENGQMIIPTSRYDPVTEKTMLIPFSCLESLSPECVPSIVSNNESNTPEKPKERGLQAFSEDIDLLFP